MTNNLDLLPCPFCGGPAEHATYSGNPVIWCRGDADCLGMMGGEEFDGTAEDLARAWNRRVFHSGETYSESADFGKLAPIGKLITGEPL